MTLLLFFFIITNKDKENLCIYEKERLSKSLFLLNKDKLNFYFYRTKNKERLSSVEKNK